MAAASHGSPRSTQHLDIVYSRQEKNLEKLIAAELTQASGLRAHFFKPAVQFNTTVIGVGDGSPLCVFTRNRRPARLGT